MGDMKRERLKVAIEWLQRMLNDARTRQQLARESAILLEAARAMFAIMVGRSCDLLFNNSLPYSRKCAWQSERCIS